VSANISAAEIVDSGACGDNITWTLTESGELPLEGSGETWSWDPYAPAPWHSVRDSILSVTISGEITEIGKFAFVQMWKSSKPVPSIATKTSTISLSPKASNRLKLMLSQNVTASQT
jgi:hypothetical protein